MEKAYMHHPQLKSRSYPGFTLIEAMVVLFVVSLITLTFYETWNVGTNNIINAKFRLGASAIANQHMEMIRALTFDNIGTTTGIPVGTITENQNVQANNTIYTVHTTVQFVDDATDGTLGFGDVAPNDYKKVTLVVSWGNASPSETISMTSIFSLDGVESVAAGTGILSINVLNGAGVGVAGATVSIVNTDIVPNVNIATFTDANGNLTFPGAKASIQGYHISVSKNGYYGNMTYDPYPISIFKPTNIHTSIVAGSLTATTLVIDEVSRIDVETVDPFGIGIPGIDFSINGGLQIGIDAMTSDNIYDFTQASVSDANGLSSFLDRSPGIYTITLDPSEVARYQFVRMTPEEPVFGTMHITPHSTQTYQMILADKTTRSALVVVTDGGGTPIVNASVRLRDPISGYDTTLTTDSYGQAYFPANNTPLLGGNYDVEVSATGFSTVTDTMSLMGNILVTKAVSL